MGCVPEDGPVGMYARMYVPYGNTLQLIMLDGTSLVLGYMRSTFIPWLGDALLQGQDALDTRQSLKLSNLTWRILPYNQ